MGRIFIYEGMGLTEEQKKRLNELDNLKDEDIVFDEDAPRLTIEQLRKFRRVSDKRTVVL